MFCGVLPLFYALDTMCMLEEQIRELARVVNNKPWSQPDVVISGCKDFCDVRKN